MCRTGLLLSVVTLAAMSSTALGQDEAKGVALPPNPATSGDKVVRTAIEDLFNQGNLARVWDYFDEDFVDHNSMPNQQPGVDGVKQFVTDFRLAFPDGRYQIDDLLVAGDYAVVRGTISGTHSGLFMRMPPTGRAIKMGVIEIYRLGGGLIIERWGQMEALGLMQQIGAMPAMLPVPPIPGSPAAVATPAVAPSPPTLPAGVAAPPVPPAKPQDGKAHPGKKLAKPAPKPGSKDESEKAKETEKQP